jgi:hypothetical protein
MAIFLSVTVALAQEHAQQRGQAPSTGVVKKAKRGPRAIGVVEFLPGGGMRLVPIALWIEGHYYDASLYGANPEPMAVEPRTVYEAQSLGEPTGTFTITEPKQVNGSWVADGTWQPHLAMDEKMASQAAKDAAKSKDSPSKVVMTGDADSGRPVLKRAPGSAADSTTSGQPAPSTSGQSTPPATTGSDSDKPVMKRPASDSSSKPTMGPTDDAPASSSTTASTAKSQTQVDDHDPNRPVLKRPPPSTPAPASGGSGGTSSTGTTSTGTTQAAAASDDNDPSRPVLSRTKVVKPQTPATPEAPATKANSASVASMKAARAYPAVSDAGQYQTRPLLYSMTPGERQIQEQQALKLAMDDIRAFAAKRNTPAIPKNATITDYDVRAYDLDYSNSPTVVLTAKLPVADAKGQVPANFSYFVTIVARVDINDQAQKIFSSVTDSRHLDAFPRMELIDALDADSNGRGDLLFRQYSDVGISYGIYRVSPYQIEKIFEGGSAL